MIQPVFWKDGSLILVNQLKLPIIYEEITYTDPGLAAQAIRDMIVRGAPAIAMTAAYGIVLAAKKFMHKDLSLSQKEILSYFEDFKQTRPTAVNLFWALERMKKCSDKTNYTSSQEWYLALESEAIAIHQEDAQACQNMGNLGADLWQEQFKEKLKLGKKLNILTHCNAGAMATGAWGTALGVIRSAHQRDMIESIWVDETRPYLQGARITAWELQKDNIPLTLITDSMAGFFMQQDKVDAIIIGADRIAKNGDVANKIGSYGLAVMAKYHNIPFYVAAPVSTFDKTCKHGKDIPIEERNTQEVTQFAGQRIAPLNIKAAHPAFDVTPHTLINAIITEKAVIKDYYDTNIAKL